MQFMLCSHARSWNMAVVPDLTFMRMLVTGQRAQCRKHAVRLIEPFSIWGWNLSALLCAHTGVPSHRCDVNPRSLHALPCVLNLRPKGVCDVITQKACLEAYKLMCTCATPREVQKFQLHIRSLNYVWQKSLPYNYGRLWAASLITQW